ncbi:something about silencing protein 10 [Chrysoperla carnea]|uniref:something about silencing protein 10 n=1 Tax=Chrysoperla carnea TaxID=189513 RepID=UPI001D09521B|nr:something about silencing protein 10 [Chrysoperla carnea]
MVRLKMSNKISFQSDNEDDKFDISDSDDFYSDKEKALLKKALKQRNGYEDSEEEIFEIHSSSDENNEESEENADSDIEKVDDNIPDDRAWGKRKKSYYSTDYVDADLNAFNAKDVDAAQFEEDEARKIQQRLLDQFDEDDFSLDVYKSKSKKNVEENQVETKIKKDLSKFLDSEKRDLILKESPELLGLIEDFKAKTKEISETLGPLLDILRKNNSNDNLLQYITLKYNVLMRYLTYVNFYVLLKSERVNVKYHPAIKQIIKYRELYNQLESINTEALKKKIHKILTSKKMITKKPVKKQKSITTEIKPKTPIKKELSKQVHFDVEDNLNKNETDSEDEGVEDLNAQNGDMEVDSIAENGKRAITYEIAKNKGLTPHRKKEQRNPRVKHRNKYRQAKIRRKGAVREVRKELSRYGGEISGIKSNVTKSIKIK